MFRQDNPLGIILDWVFTQFLLNLMFLLFSIPIFTVGVSATALYEMEYAVLEKRDGKLFSEFFRAFRNNFKKGMGVMLAIIVLIIIAGGITGAAFLLGVDVKLVAFFAFLFAGGILVWIVALIGRFEQKFSIIIQNAFLMSVRNLPLTLLLSLISFGLYALIGLIPEVFFSGYAFVVQFFAPAVTTYLCTVLIMKCLRKQFPDLFPEKETEEG